MKRIIAIACFAAVLIATSCTVVEEDLSFTAQVTVESLGQSSGQSYELWMAAESIFDDIESVAEFEERGYQVASGEFSQSGDYSFTVHASSAEAEEGNYVFMIKISGNYQRQQVKDGISVSSGSMISVSFSSSLQ